MKTAEDRNEVALVCHYIDCAVSHDEELKGCRIEQRRYASTVDGSIRILLVFRPASEEQAVAFNTRIVKIERALLWERNLFVEILCVDGSRETDDALIEQDFPFVMMGRPRANEAMEAMDISFENDLIHPDKWPELYDQMPDECREVVDGPPDVIGIGRNEKYGWFIACSGQGPFVAWSER